MPFNERIHFPNITCRDAVSIHTGNGMDTCFVSLFKVNPFILLQS